MKRFIVFDLDGRITEAMRYERINGEHKLDVKTTQPLEEGLRILTRDGTLKWREWVVDEPDEHKQDYDIVEGSYGCTWSVQYDLSTVSGGELWPGTYTPITAGAALAMVLAVQSRWEVGRVTVTGTAGTSLFDGSVWDYLGKLQEVWGGEIEPRIEVDSNGVTHRYVDWLEHVGNSQATRRFDYGEDCTGISRKPPVGPMCCRIVPRGGRDATDEDGISYSERVGVEEEPYSSGDGWVHDAGSIWIRDTDAEQNFRTPNPDGTWHYPELVVTYDTDDPEELVWLASADIHKYTRPVPTYEADVLQFAAAGMDAHGVALGDVVHIVDKKFGDAPLRIEARVVEMTVNELDESDVRLVIGEATQGIEAAFKSMRSAIDAAEERARRVEGGGTIVYLQNLLDEINAQIAADGGYTYLVGGQGSITYDKAVADPTIGTEATKVTQIKGGGIRIADEKKPSFSGIEDWVWKSLIVAGHIAAELVTAAHITAGYIGSPNDAVFLDFDNHVFEIGNATTIGDTTVGELLQDVASAGIDTIEYGTSASSATAPTSWSTTAPTSVAKGSWLWIRTTYKNGTTSTTKAYAGTDGQNGQDGADGSDGQDGADGIGIASVIPQYYLSTSNTSATGGSWSSTPPTWSADHYIWTRNFITWDSNPVRTSTTDEVYDAALTQANQQAAQAIADAAEAAKVATNYLTFNRQDGLDVGYDGTNAKTRINGSGIELFDANNVSTLFAGKSGSNSIVRVGRASGSGNVIASSLGYVDVRNASTVMAHFGYDDGANISGGISKAPYYDVGIRLSNSQIGNYSFVSGFENTASDYAAHAEGIRTAASGYSSHAEGNKTTASGNYSHAEGSETTASNYEAHAEGFKTVASGSGAHAEGYFTEATGYNCHAEGTSTKATYNGCHAEGNKTTASGSEAHAEGNGTEASGNWSHAEGVDTVASGDRSHAGGSNTIAAGNCQTAIGEYNVSNTTHTFIIGCGSSSGGRRNALYVSAFGNLWINGTLTQGSDRRLKEHHSYLAEDACDFIRALKPALYTKDGARHVGFYAQDVQEAEPDEWDTVTVTEQHTDESLDFDPLTLDYQALIAPLVAYAQQLERRIDQQQQAIEAITKRLDALEGR